MYSFSLEIFPESFAEADLGAGGAGRGEVGTDGEPRTTFLKPPQDLVFKTRSWSWRTLRGPVHRNRKRQTKKQEQPSLFVF